MTKKQIYSKLMKFLEINNATANFNKAVKERSANKDIRALIDFIVDENKRTADIIALAFVWEAVDGSYTYWSKLSVMWYAYIRNDTNQPDIQKLNSIW